MTVLRILETSLDSSDQKFQSLQLFLCCFFAETHADAGNRNAHFQQAVIDSGVSSILWVPYLVQCQIGRDDQGLPAAVATVYNVVDLFQCVLGATLHTEIVNDEQRIAAQSVYDFIPTGKAVVQLVQDPVDAVCAIASLIRSNSSQPYIIAHTPDQDVKCRSGHLHLRKQPLHDSFCTGHCSTLFISS